MTNEALCLEYQAGNQAAGERLLEKNRGLIRKISAEMSRKNPSTLYDRQDFEQEGAMALMRAASHFDAEKCASFGTYAATAIRNAICSVLRIDDDESDTVPLTEDEETPEDSETGAEDEWALNRRMDVPAADPYYFNPEQIYMRKESMQRFFAALNALTPRERAWVLQKYGLADGDSLSTANLMEKYGITRARAAQLEEQILAHIKEILTG